jgi:hypothetical protein
MENELENLKLSIDEKYESLVVSKIKKYTNEHIKVLLYRVTRNEKEESDHYCELDIGSRLMIGIGIYNYYDSCCFDGPQLTIWRGLNEKAKINKTNYSKYAHHLEKLIPNFKHIFIDNAHKWLL